MFEDSLICPYCNSDNGRNKHDDGAIDCEYECDSCKKTFLYDCVLVYEYTINKSQSEVEEAANPNQLTLFEQDESEV
jgi:transposase-like protein